MNVIYCVVHMNATTASPDYKVPQCGYECALFPYLLHRITQRRYVYLVKSGPHVHLIKKKKNGHRISELADQGPSNPSNNPISLYPLVLSYPSLAGLCVPSGFCFYLLPTPPRTSRTTSYPSSCLVLGLGAQHIYLIKHLSNYCSDS